MDIKHNRSQTILSTQKAKRNLTKAAPNTIRDATRAFRGSPSESQNASQNAVKNNTLLERNILNQNQSTSNSETSLQNQSTSNSETSLQNQSTSNSENTLTPEERNFALNEVSNNGFAIADNQGWNIDKEVVIEAVKREGYALEFASNELKDDKEVVLAAVTQDGDALQFASNKKKGDKDVALAAVGENGRALFWTSDARKEDIDVVKKAAQNCRDILDIVSPGIAQAVLKQLNKDN